MKLLFVLLTFLTVLNAQKDFYYSFIDSNGKQISEETKQTIKDGFDILENIKELRKEKGISHEAMAQKLGKTQTAYTKIQKKQTKHIFC